MSNAPENDDVQAMSEPERVAFDAAYEVGKIGASFGKVNLKAQTQKDLKAASANGYDLGRAEWKKGEGMYNDDSEEEDAMSDDEDDDEDEVCCPHPVKPFLAI